MKTAFKINFKRLLKWQYNHKTLFYFVNKVTNELILKGSKAVYPENQYILY